MRVANLQVALGMLIAAMSLVSIAFADTGAGGGCHADIYFTTDAQGRITQMTMYCKNVDCSVGCPPNGGSGPGTGGYTTCYCPSLSGLCNAGYQIVPGGVNFACIWGCGGGEVCEWGLFDLTPQDTPFYEQGYRRKFVCWCD